MQHNLGETYFMYSVKVLKMKLFVQHNKVLTRTNNLPIFNNGTAEQFM